jgi:hypothetical protein
MGPGSIGTSIEWTPDRQHQKLFFDIATKLNARSDARKCELIAHHGPGTVPSGQIATIACSDLNGGSRVRISDTVHDFIAEQLEQLHVGHLAKSHSTPTVKQLLSLQVVNRHNSVSLPLSNRMEVFGYLAVSWQRNPLVDYPLLRGRSRFPGSN